jgi:1-acyl-sn-glycerol-3-phosphate acyltransferase
LTALRLLLILLHTIVLGTVAILLCLPVPGGRLFTPLARLWSRLVLLTAGVRWRASYHPGLDPSRASVYMANHKSQFDIPALVLAMPADFRFVAKRELLFIPIFGWALWLAGFAFVDRGDREQAIRSLDQAAAKVRRGTSIIVFAEGTRSPDDRLLPFKKGGFMLAMKAGAPIVPVSIRGSRGVLPKGSLRLRPGTIDLVFGAPIDTSLYSIESRDALMEAVREAIASGLGGEGRSVPAPGAVS